VLYADWLVRGATSRSGFLPLRVVSQGTLGALVATCTQQLESLLVLRFGITESCTDVVEAAPVPLCVVDEALPVDVLLPAADVSDAYAEAVYAGVRARFKSHERLQAEWGFSGFYQSLRAVVAAGLRPPTADHLTVLDTSGWKLC
jgi:hypothetical protein